MVAGCTCVVGEEVVVVRQQPRPTYTDSAIVAGVTGIEAAHVEQLRTAVLVRAR